MDAKLLGQRIKEARLAKKMTQSEVVGSFITRNMLSQIESGVAVPSMKTLTYLAQVLELPPALLLQDAPDTGEATADSTLSSVTVFPETAAYCRAKDAFLKEEYDTAYEVLSSLPDSSALSDEIYALTARVTFALASRHFENTQYLEALNFAKDAGDAAAKGMFASNELKSKALLLLSDAATKLARPD